MHTKGKISIAVVGGDDRELILIWELIKKGYMVQVFGFPANILPPETRICSTVSEAVSNTKVVILPIPGINQNGILHSKYSETKIQVGIKDFEQIPPKTKIFVGISSQYLKQLAQKANFKLIEIANLDEIAIPNSIPTAEGAIQLAMEKLPTTIHSSQSFIVGFGRVAETLAWMLKGLGANITVAARNPVQLAKCRVYGYRTISLIDLKDYIKEANVVFNTVPALIITKDILNVMNKQTLIVDLASNPGGTDFSSAKELGISALLALGLPGKVAPVTAGKILAEVYPKLIEKWVET